MKSINTYITLVIIFLLFHSCNDAKLFSLQGDSSGVIFENKLEYTKIHNDFKNLVEELIGELIAELGVT